MSAVPGQAWVGAGFIVQYSAQAGRAVVLARLLSPHDLGLYFVFRSVAVAAAVATQLGLGQVGLRRIAAASTAESARETLAGVLRITRGASAVAFPLALVFGWSAGLRPIDAALGAALVLTLAWTATLSELGRGLGRTITVSAIERVVAGTLDIGGFVLILTVAGRCTLTDALAVTVAVSAIPLALLAREVHRATPRTGHADPATHPPQATPPHDLLREAWPVAGNALLWRALSEIDLWLVASLTSPAQAAVYGIALRLALPLDLPKAVTAYHLSPAIAQAHAAGRTAALERMLKRAARWTTLATLTLFAAIAAIGPRGLAVLFGGNYSDAMPIFTVLALGRIVSALSGLPGMTLLMTGRARTLMTSSLLSVCAIVAGALVMIPPLGPAGAAVAATAGTSLQCVLMVAAVRRYAEVSVHAGPRFD